MKQFFSLFLLLILYTFASGKSIVQLQIDNAISPASVKYLDDGFNYAKKIDSSLILIKLDTPGGLSSSMRKMIQKILESKIPIIIYVYPKGARAASAGTYLMYASHIAVMAPGTNIGAATPVNLIPNPKINQEPNKKTSESKMEKKVLNDSIAYLKSIAELRDRNINWAISAVKEGNSISAKEAKEKNVIDFIANNIDELLKKINKKEIIIDEKKIIIDTQNTNIVPYNPSWKIELLRTIANPNIAYIFLIIAIYGVLFEMMNPGAIFPGVLGLFSASIALYSLNILPFDYAGLLFIFLGIALMLLEVFIVGFGISGIIGVVSFAFGSIMLFDEKTLGTSISIPLVLAISLVSFGFFIYLLGYLIKVRKQKSIIDFNNMAGSKVKVLKIIKNSYKVEYKGEIWNAKSDETFCVNDIAKIESVSGLTLNIRS